MSMSTSEAAATLGRSQWPGKTAEQRRAQTAPARLASAVKTVCDRAPDLTEEQRNRLRVILTQAPTGGGRDAG
jgi:hypothetical protein